MSRIVDIAERIVAGDDVCDHEIWEYNAGFVIKNEERRAKAGPHEPKGCKSKDCTHNIGDDLWYAAELAMRAQRTCTCGRYN